MDIFAGCNFQPTTDREGHGMLNSPRFVACSNSEWPGQQLQREEWKP